jgi:hypothetical protein
MSTPSSWQLWASNRQRKDLFVVSISPSTGYSVPAPKPPQLPTPPARSTGRSQLETGATLPTPPQYSPPPITSITKTSNQPKTETSTSHHPLTLAAPPRSTSAPSTPPKKRPETTDVVARRLIGRALGITFAKREGEGEGERFGINTKTERQPRPQTKSAAELELVKKMEEVEIS